MLPQRRDVATKRHKIQKSKIRSPRTNLRLAFLGPVGVASEGRTTTKHCHENACLSCTDDRPGRLSACADAAKPIAAQIVSHKGTKTQRAASELKFFLCVLL